MNNPYSAHLRRSFTSQKAIFRTVSSSNACEHILPQFSPIVRSSPGGVFTDLCPREFRRIAFGSTGRKFRFLQARIAFQLVLHLVTTMHWMPFPHSNRVLDMMQQTFQESDDFVSTD